MKHFNDQVAYLATSLHIPRFVKDASLEYVTRLPYTFLFWDHEDIYAGSLAIISLAGKLLLDRDESEFLVKRINNKISIAGKVLQDWELKIATSLGWKLHFECT